MEITFEEFIKNHTRVAPEEKHIELTPVQYAFLDWCEENKGKNIKFLKKTVIKFGYSKKLSYICIVT